jgi:hypothetical protein
LKGTAYTFANFFTADFSLATNPDDAKNVLVSRTLGQTRDVHSWKGTTYAHTRFREIVCIEQTNASTLNLGMSRPNKEKKEEDDHAQDHRQFVGYR